MSYSESTQRILRFVFIKDKILPEKQEWTGKIFVAQAA